MYVNVYLVYSHILIKMFCAIYKSDKDFQLSKSLSWLLRHGAVSEGLEISPNGYVDVNVILQHRSIRGKFLRADVERVVHTNNKKRFILRQNPQNKKLEVKATQGHSIDISDAELLPITKPIYKTVVHGTYMKCWPQIKAQGLSRMKRRHIHFAKGTLEDKNIISGLRKNIQIYVFINLQKALDDGVKFYESENGVILTSGKEGVLAPKYFEKVIKINSGMFLYLYK
ncbi:hypothetical protein ACJJTC_016381 [Scirpophaga incertulas]